MKLTIRAKSKGLIWCLFDGSGIMALPWAKAGYRVKCFNADDADHGPYSNLAARIEHPNIEYVNTWIDDVFIDWALAAAEKPAFIFAFPPCTDLANSGSRAWEAKRAIDPLFQEKAAATAKIAETIANALGVPFMVENPVGRLSTLWRKPDIIFNPWQLGGYLPRGDVHPWFPEFIKARDAYPKLTCLWTGNGFTMPTYKPVAVDDGYSDQYKRLGGNSPRTKVIRSLTPRGLAAGVFEANS